MSLFSEQELLESKLYAIVYKETGAHYTINRDFFLVYKDYDKAFKYVNKPERVDTLQVYEIEDKTEFFVKALELGINGFLLDGEGAIHVLGSYPFIASSKPGIYTVTDVKPVSETETALSDNTVTLQQEEQITEEYIEQPEPADILPAETVSQAVQIQTDETSAKEPVTKPNVKAITIPEGLKKVLNTVGKILLITWIVFCLIMTIASVFENSADIFFKLFFAALTVIGFLMLTVKKRWIFLLNISVFFCFIGAYCLNDGSTGAAITMFLLGVLIALPAIF